MNESEILRNAQSEISREEARHVVEKLTITMRAQEKFAKLLTPPPDHPPLKRRI
jgi:hypothetical protein